MVDDWNVGVQDFIKNQVFQLKMWPETFEIPMIVDPRLTNKFTQLLQIIVNRVNIDGPTTTFFFILD